MASYNAGDAAAVASLYTEDLRRQADGSWKLTRGIDNSPPPPPAAVSGSN